MASLIAPIAIAIVLIVGARLFSRHRHQRRERLLAIAAEAGLEIALGPRPVSPSGFSVLNRGRRQQITSQMWRAGDQDSVYQYRYTEGSGKNSTITRLTVAVVNVPFRAPHLTISTENWWSRMKRTVGLRDIEVESPEFNERYQVRCGDERFAIALLDQRMISYLLSPASGLGTITFELLDGWMLCHCPQLKPEQLPEMLWWAQSVREQFPTVLNDLYRL